jgi:hypothetical protein
MGTTTETILCTIIDASTTQCQVSSDFVIGTMTYGDILIAFFLFLLILGGVSGFIIKRFLNLWS